MKRKARAGKGTESCLPKPRWLSQCAYPSVAQWTVRWTLPLCLCVTLVVLNSAHCWPVESEERRWESAGHPVGGLAQPRQFYLIGSAAMLENAGGARAGEFFDEVVTELTWTALVVDVIVRICCIKTSWVCSWDFVFLLVFFLLVFWRLVLFSACCFKWWMRLKCYCSLRISWRAVMVVLRWQKWKYAWNQRIGSSVWRQCLWACLCLALSDAKVNNQSETTKCAMESGDGNTGEWSPAFSPIIFIFKSECV